MRALRKLWQSLMEISGDADYARYCAHLRSRHPEKTLPTAREHYLARLEDKYSRPNRCC